MVHSRLELITVALLRGAWKIHNLKPLLYMQKTGLAFQYTIRDVFLFLSTWLEKQKGDIAMNQDVPGIAVGVSITNFVNIISQVP